MDYYFVDYENVHADGFTGIQRLKEGDIVCVLYTEQSRSFSLEILESIERQGAVFEACKASVGSKNALDFQLSSYLGYMIAKNQGSSGSRYFIISKDTGYDRLVEFWGERNVVVRRAAHFMDAERIVKMEAKEQAQADAKAKVKNKSKVAEEDKATKEELLQYLTEEEYSDRILEIVNSYKTRIAINNAFSKEFRDSQRSSMIYKKLKMLFKQKRKT